MNLPDVAPRFMAAVEAGDVDAARACMQPDAKIWHNYDNIEQTVDENMALLERMIDACEKRHYDITRLEPTSDGYVQRHCLYMTTKSGIDVKTNALALITVKNGKISYIEEFLDPSAIIKAFQG